ncbi:putative molecular chaperone [Prochlorococcus marinus str. MIT 9515]|uniref:Putative molecular chaperone n=1 Tax=Prochlorococcus marinus (strain MIT 9515) TaxID=167542 RepID=A2BUB5_PROM5|nr:molecular chaperone [Prochlorococcus marinus]ABM71376.1 putative molecular chaperone [Prochlorococcus marinus str. MIT 9515]
MPYDKKNFNKLTLAIHSTDNSFAFAYRENNQSISDNFFTKKFEKDLCNNLIVDFSNFITKENLKRIDKISVSTGPSNFNASRQIIVLARTLAQQINCSIDSFSSFELMAKRIALKNNINSNKNSFWIFKKLKRRGYIAGKYQICISEKTNNKISIKEKIIPKIFEELINIDSSYQAEYSDIEDLKELLNLSDNNVQNSKSSTWKKVLPLYPLSPIN